MQPVKPYTHFEAGPLHGSTFLRHIIFRLFTVSKPEVDFSILLLVYLLEELFIVLTPGAHFCIWKVSTVLVVSVKLVGLVTV